MGTPHTMHRARAIAPHATAPILIAGLLACATSTPSITSVERQQPQQYEHQETRDLVMLVADAARLVETRGEAAFATLSMPDSRWRQRDDYIFVIAPDGEMLVHPDPALQGSNQLALKDINGRPIIRGLIDAATAVPGKADGWYHYEWPVPGGLLPRWKSSYVRLAAAPSGKRYVVGSGVYNDRMERAFVVDMVKNAVAQIEKDGERAFPIFRDRRGAFMAKDAYVFVIEPGGVERVNPAHPNLEGRNLRDVKDTQGKQLVREMFGIVERQGSGWVDYLWPKPGESVSTLKSTYVTKAKVGSSWVLVGSGVYLADAPTVPTTTATMTASELMEHVREGASLLAQRGAGAFADFREKGSKWFHDDTYFFVWTADGRRVFHAADSTMEGRDARGVTDVLGRPYGKMFLEVAASASGEGWAHYMFPEPGSLFPAWKSVFAKRVAFPNGKQHLIGAGIYNMQMDTVIIRDIVDRAAALIEARGTAAFEQLRDRKGPFVFMDTYVFVERADGVEMVNAGQPSLEGTNLIAVQDVNGKYLVRDYIDGAMKHGAVWIEYYWYKPGHNEPARKLAYVRRVETAGVTYVVGSGLYVEQETLGRVGSR